MTNYRITRKDIEYEVDRLNRQYKKNDNTAIKFGVRSAYGGHQVVLQGNRKYGFTGETNVTYGFQTPRETISDLYKAESRGLKRAVEYWHKRAMEIRKSRKRK